MAGAFGRIRRIAWIVSIPPSDSCITRSVTIRSTCERLQIWIACLPLDALSTSNPAPDRTSRRKVRTASSSSTPGSRLSSSARFAVEPSGRARIALPRRSIALWRGGFRPYSLCATNMSQPYNESFALDAAAVMAQTFLMVAGNANAVLVPPDCWKVRSNAAMV